MFEMRQDTITPITEEEKSELRDMFNTIISRQQVSKEQYYHLYSLFLTIKNNPLKSDSNE